MVKRRAETVSSVLHLINLFKSLHLCWPRLRVATNQGRRWCMITDILQKHMLFKSVIRKNKHKLNTLIIFNIYYKRYVLSFTQGCLLHLGDWWHLAALKNCYHLTTSNIHYYFEDFTKLLIQNFVPPCFAGTLRCLASTRCRSGMRRTHWHSQRPDCQVLIQSRTILCRAWCLGNDLALWAATGAPSRCLAAATLWICITE